MRALTELIGCQIGEEAKQSSAKICGCLDTLPLCSRLLGMNRKCHAHLITSCTTDLAAVSLTAQGAFIQRVAS